MAPAAGAYSKSPFTIRFVPFDVGWLARALALGFFGLDSVSVPFSVLAGSDGWLSGTKFDARAGPEVKNAKIDELVMANEVMITAKFGLLFEDGIRILPLLCARLPNVLRVYSSGLVSIFLEARSGWNHGL